MDSIERRSGLLAICGCAISLLLPRAEAQELSSPTSSSSPKSDPWPIARSHVTKASGMSASVVSSLDTLTSQTAKALDQVELLQQKLNTLGFEISKLRSTKAEILEEYRNGMFCSGCGKTRSQILAVGDRFPHPGQSIVRPTPEQIAAKERELQAPIDSAQRRLVDAQKDLEENRNKSNEGLEQIRVGVRFWRTATSYAEASLSRGSAQSHSLLLQQKAELSRNLEGSQRALTAARSDDVAEAARSEVKTWQRLLTKHEVDSEAFSAVSHKAKLQLTERNGEERQKVMSFIARGKLFARVGGPPIVPIYSSTTDQDMGVGYLMGRLPEPGRHTHPLDSVVQFCSAYRSSGSEHLLASYGAGAASVTPLAAPAAPAVRAPVPAPVKLLQALP